MRLRRRPTAPTRRHPDPAAASWRAWHRADDLDACRALLARLEHHARTFPTPTPLLDDLVVRRAALDLLDTVR